MFVGLCLVFFINSREHPDAWNRQPSNTTDPRTTVFRLIELAHFDPNDGVAIGLVTLQNKMRRLNICRADYAY